MTDSRKRALYLLLPCVLAFAAMFLNGLFKPQLQWQVRLLESSVETDRIEGLGEQTRPLFATPDVRAYSVDGYRCTGPVDIRYVQNKLLKDKPTLENWINLNNGFASWVAFLAVFQMFVYILYRMQQKYGWAASIAFVFLSAIVVIAIVTVLGPLTGIHPACIVLEMKVEAELMSISLDGILYPFIGAFLNVLAVIMMIKFYRVGLPPVRQAEQ